MKNIHRTFVTR